MIRNPDYDGFGREGTIRSSEEIKEYVNGQIIKLWKESVRAFVITAIQEVPIDTGMSRASFLPLAAQVRLRSDLVAFASGQKRRRTDFDVARSPYANNNADFKSRTLGESIARSGPNYTLKFGTPKEPRLEFSFDIVILQHFLLENGHATPHIDSLIPGQEAFLRVFNSKFDTIVDSKAIVKWLTTGRVPSG